MFNEKKVVILGIVFFSANLNESEQLVVSEVFTLAVDQEVTELCDRQAKHAERGILHARAIAYDAGRRNGVRDLLLILRQRLPWTDQEAHVRAIPRQQV